MVDKIDILANFDLDNNLSDCSSDENLSDLTLSESSSENCFEECTNEDTVKKLDESEEFFKRETVVVENSKNKTDENETKSDIVSVTSEETFKLDSPKIEENNQQSQPSYNEINEGLETAKEIETVTSPRDDNEDTFEDRISNPSEIGSNDFHNDEFSQMENSLGSNYSQFLKFPEKNEEKNDVYDRFEKNENKKIENNVKEYQETEAMTPDEKRFQNLQEEINLLNILMFEAENQTEKCGSLYNSFTNEINNNLAYSKSGVVDGCAGSLNSLVDGSKFDALSVKSELLFSDYGKSESNSELEKGDKTPFDDAETKSVSSTHQTLSVDSEDKACKDCENSKKWDHQCNDASSLPNEDRIIVLWNQIIRLKCSLKNLQLNLKEQQMETLMQINEFLINQNISSNQILNEKAQSSSSYTTFDRNKEAKNIQEKISDTSLIFTENNKIRENIALNDLKIALIECNLLSSTASSLVDSIPQYECSNSALLKSRSNLNLNFRSSNTCCCENIKQQRSLCFCPTKSITDLKSGSMKCEEKHRLKRLPFFTALEEKNDRKVKSNEEIGNKFPETKYCLSDVRLDEISPRACI